MSVYYLPDHHGISEAMRGRTAGFTGEARMAFGTHQSLTGLLCWEATFGFALLLMDDSRYCLLHLEDLDEALLGAMVQVEGKHLADSVLGVETLTPLGVRIAKA